MSTDPLRLNLGSGDYPLDGWTNVDLVPPADIVGDFRRMSFQDVKAIQMNHVLEHIPRGDCMDTLRMVLTWLRPGGTLEVEVPDMEVILRFGSHVDGWEQAIYGAQIHEGEYHTNGFTADTLVRTLCSAGFAVTWLDTFLSEVPARVGYPCLRVAAIPHPG